jgi:hypothetical protein
MGRTPRHSEQVFDIGGAALAARPHHELKVESGENRHQRAQLHGRLSRLNPGYGGLAHGDAIAEGGLGQTGSPAIALQDSAELTLIADDLLGHCEMIRECV